MHIHASRLNYTLYELLCLLKELADYANNNLFNWLQQEVT